MNQTGYGLPYHHANQRAVSRMRTARGPVSSVGRFNVLLLGVLPNVRGAETRNEAAGS
jgi:hypothetical protein